MVVSHEYRTYLVTGGGSGIGRATAIRLAESGAEVWVNDLNGSAAERVVDEIRAHNGVAHAIPGDVAQPSGWVAALSARAELHGVVHCAGYDASTPADSGSRQEFEKLLAVMVTGPFELTQKLIPAMANANGACVMFISSVHAMATEPAVDAYAACKAAQIGMVRAMAQDLGPNRIRALTVAPGYVDTPLLAKFFDGEPEPTKAREHAAGLHPLGRIGKPEDIANAVTFLLSPLAEFINATTLVVDGALTAQLYR